MSSEPDPLLDNGREAIIDMLRHEPYLAVKIIRDTNFEQQEGCARVRAKILPISSLSFALAALDITHEYAPPVMPLRPEENLIHRERIRPSSIGHIDVVGPEMLVALAHTGAKFKGCEEYKKLPLSGFTAIEAGVEKLEEIESIERGRERYKKMPPARAPWER